MKKTVSVLPLIFILILGVFCTSCTNNQPEKKVITRTLGSGNNNEISDHYYDTLKSFEELYPDAIKIEAQKIENYSATKKMYQLMGDKRLAMGLASCQDIYVTSSRITKNPKEPSKGYLQLYVSVSNRTLKSINLSKKDFSVMDKRGYLFNPTIESTFFANSQVPATSTKGAWLTFSISNDVLSKMDKVKLFYLVNENVRKFFLRSDLMHNILNYL